MIDPNWKSILKKAHSVRVAFFWGAFAGLCGLSDTLKDFVSPTTLLLITPLMMGVLAVGRVTKQPGLE